ncbi:MAG: DUF1080 domain-containing protein [Acidobacteria bacterium]|nr:DUF1080 domain-containing protein [Acidobacteriota bacterium]
MRYVALIVLIAGVAITPALSQKESRVALVGRWDLTVNTGKETYPSWLEYRESSNGPTVRVVGKAASVHPGQDVKVEGATLTFTTSEWFDKPTRVTWEVTASGARLTGTQKRADGTIGRIVGTPQPSLKHAAPVHWTDPAPLFNGKDLAGWVPDDPANNHWKAIAGELVNEKAGANLRSTRSLRDFKLHIEYNCPDGANSGVYLRGRYEIQVAYPKPGASDRLHDMGALYGFIAPSADLPRKPGTWETYDVTLIGRMVTVVRDGVTTIENQEIPGITGGALDSREGDPGFIYLQGDETGGNKYRKITISVPEQ